MKQFGFTCLLLYVFQPRLTWFFVFFLKSELTVHYKAGVSVAIIMLFKMIDQNKKAPVRDGGFILKLDNDSGLAHSIKIPIRILRLLPEAFYQNTRAMNLDAHHPLLDPLYIHRTGPISTH